VFKHLVGRPVELRLCQPTHKQARGAYLLDVSTVKTMIRFRPFLWNEDREQFFSIYLHETAHTKFHAAALLPSNGKALPLVRSSSIRGQLLGVRDSLDELRADSQALEWFVFAGKGPMMARVLQLLNWCE
jgi:hypothetical protein